MRETSAAIGASVYSQLSRNRFWGAVKCKADAPSGKCLYMVAFSSRGAPFAYGTQLDILRLCSGKAVFERVSRCGAA